VTSKKAALDLATSERDLLLKKATDFNSALAAAQETVTRIDEETKAKVRSCSLSFMWHTNINRLIATH
jgi:hypothetical protein